MSHIIIHTDGACSKNPGPGGWAVILPHKESYEVMTGHEEYTTNNRMELLAVVSGIRESIRLGYDHITVCSDSAYVINPVLKKWLDKWKADEWQTKDKNDVKNCDLWKRLDKLLHKDGIYIRFNKVAGHSGNTFNELADKYAKQAVEVAKQLACK